MTHDIDQADVALALCEHAVQHEDLLEVFGHRIFQGMAPQGVSAEEDQYPRAIVTQVSSPAYDHLRGPANLASPRLQIDSYAESVEDRARCARAWRAVLRGYRGPMGSDALRVRAIKFLDERMTEEPRADGTDEWLFRVSQDVRITFKR